MTAKRESNLRPERKCNVHTFGCTLMDSHSTMPWVCQSCVKLQRGEQCYSTSAKLTVWQLNIQPRDVLWIFDCFSQTFALPESIHLSDTQTCEKPSRNKLRYANPIKSEFTTFVLFARLYGNVSWLPKLLKDCLQVFAIKNIPLRWGTHFFHFLIKDIFYHTNKSSRDRKANQWQQMV